MTDPVRNAPVPPHRSLLPPNATPQERALEGATERAASVPVPLRETWNPETCPAALLPWLAWAFSIDEWREDWSEGAKRASIRDAVMIHRRKGTVWAIKRVLANAGYGDARLIEGNSGIRYDGSFRHDGVHTYGDPKGWARYAFNMSRPITRTQGEAIRKMLLATAPARCHLLDLYFTDARFYDGQYHYNGEFNHGAA